MLVSFLRLGQLGDLCFEVLEVSFFALAESALCSSVLCFAFLDKTC